MEAKPGSILVSSRGTGCRECSILWPVMDVAFVLVMGQLKEAEVAVGWEPVPLSHQAPESSINGVSAAVGPSVFPLSITDAHERIHFETTDRGGQRPWTACTTHPQMSQAVVRKPKTNLFVARALVRPKSRAL